MLGLKTYDSIMSSTQAIGKEAETDQILDKDDFNPPPIMLKHNRKSANKFISV
jgi:hypothetical protein